MKKIKINANFESNKEIIELLIDGTIVIDMTGNVHLAGRDIVLTKGDTLIINDNGSVDYYQEF